MMNKTDRNERWRVTLRQILPAKERTSIPRAKMPELNPTFRINNVREVNQGYSTEQAILEATRCLDCPDPGCIKGCPVHNDIPGFIKNVERENFREAIRVLHNTTVLPAVCGRVCPQEKQCESSCIYNKMNKEPVAIGNLERFAADFDRLDGNLNPRPEPVLHLPRIPVKVAVVGSGPSGLAFAADMNRRGFSVTVFEALDQFGGVLKYGIPEFCLPNEVVEYEINTLKLSGVTFVKDCFVGKSLSYSDLHKMGFKGIYIATGAGKPRLMDIPGENLPGVMTANEYLIRLNLTGSSIFGNTALPLEGKRVAVIGGGNTAIDAVRFAVRKGAEEAMIIYRRGIEEMPARLEEIKHAEEEGVKFITLCNPVEFIGNERGFLDAIKIQHMQLGEPDESGRRRPIPIPDAVEIIDVDIVVESVGYLPNPPESLPQMAMTHSGCIVVDEESMKSSSSSIYAGGDIVRGPATVILAMGDGRRAAKSMAEAFDKAFATIEL